MSSVCTSKKAVVLDLGDVLFDWSPPKNLKVTSKQLRCILQSPTWAAYERGEIDQATCYDLVASFSSVASQDVADAFTQARESLTPNKKMVSFLQNMKQLYSESVKFYAMSNISKEDFAYLAKTIEGWNLFTDCFPSGHAGARKPELRFFESVREELGLEPENVIFLDDKKENVSAAQSLGIQGVVFTESASAIARLQYFITGSSSHGKEFLRQNAQNLRSFTDSGVIVPDNFAQLLILEVTEDRSLIDMEWGSRQTWNFFAGEPILVPGGYFPDDLDTTCLALMTLPRDDAFTASLLDRIATYANPDGTMQTYFDRTKCRVDAVVSANVLACFFANGRGHELEKTLSLVQHTLETRAYMKGTRYYPSPDCCLYFFSRLLRSSDDQSLQEALSDLLEERVKERIGCEGDALELAMRVATCVALGIACDEDCQSLMSLQATDGSWKGGWMYRYGSTGMRFGNDGVTTAFAVAALESWSQCRSG